MIRISSGRIDGGVDSLKLIVEYVVSDKTPLRTTNNEAGLPPSEAPLGFGVQGLGHRIEGDHTSVLAAAVSRGGPVTRPETLHPAPCTLHPAPCTLHPALCTLARDTPLPEARPPRQARDVDENGPLSLSLSLSLYISLSFCHPHTHTHTVPFHGPEAGP